MYICVYGPYFVLQPFFVTSGGYFAACVDGRMSGVCQYMIEPTGSGIRKLSSKTMALYYIYIYFFLPMLHSHFTLRNITNKCTCLKYILSVCVCWFST